MATTTLESVRARSEKIYREHRSLCIALLTLIVIIIGSIVFYHRYPENFNYPNFFAEDGQHFTANIMKKGFFGGLLKPFNGYFIFGIYILTEIGFLINRLIYAGQFVDLPASLAITSYIFLATCCALPIYLLKDYLKLQYRLLITLFMLFLPMPSFDYGTIGTIGNLKFAFVFISVLVVLYMMKLPRKSKQIPWLDFVIAISLFTTAGAYIALPFMLLCDGLHPKNIRSLKSWKKLIHKSNIALWGFLSLVFIGLIQVVYVGINGVPLLKGYLTQPYEPSKTIEVFIARQYLYPFVAAGYHHLDNLIVLILFAAALYAIVKYGTKAHRWVYFFCLFSIFSTTLIFIANRTGVTFYYNHYTTTGFDNFFYTQNFIAIVAAVFLLSDLSIRFKWFRTYRIAVVLSIIVVIGELYASSTHAPNNFMQYQIGTLKQQASKSCQTNASSITFSVYPFTYLTMTEPRSVVCTKAINGYTPVLDSYGLMTKDVDPFNVSPSYPHFTQTFKASSDNLKGLAVYLSTYRQTVLKNYKLELKNGTCSQTLESVSLPKYVQDNAFATIQFPSQHNSYGKLYCFTIVPTNSAAQQLALQYSQVNFSPDLTLKLNGIPQTRDAVFQAIY